LATVLPIAIFGNGLFVAWLHTLLTGRPHGHGPLG
jgi:hypothetical protein